MSTAFLNTNQGKLLALLTHIPLNLWSENFDLDIAEISYSVFVHSDIFITFVCCYFLPDLCISNT